jgi:hypothetical protein
MKRKDQRSMLMLAIIMAFVVGVFWAGPVGAGDLEPPADAVDGDENPVSTMCTLQDICDKLDSMDEKVVGAAVEKTGQTAFYVTGDDGDLEKGFVWPNPRFTDNGDETVTDNLTGLIWLKNASRFGSKTWSNALNDCNTLADDGTNLTDGSSAGDWRLPNVKELQSLIDCSNFDPCLPDGHPFSGVSVNYWSSTTRANYPYVAWFAYLSYGGVYYDDKDDNFYVWPVRGGQ